MKIDLTKVKPLAASMMMARGLPRAFLYRKLDLTENILLPCTHSRRQPIHPKIQLAAYAKAWEQPRGSWWMVVGSEADDDMVEAALSGLFWRATILHAQEPAKYKRPLAWRVVGGFEDRLRDNSRYRDDLGNIGLLAITNLADNSTNSKIEKVRDLVSMFPDTPRIVSVAGCDPLQFALDKLRMSPQKVLFLGRKAKFRQV